MWIHRKFYDQADGGGAPAGAPPSVTTPVTPSAPPAPANASPASPAPTGQPAPAQAVDPAVASLREKMKAQINKWSESTKAKDAEPIPGNTPRNISPELANGQRQVEASKTTPPAAPVTPATPEPPAPAEPPAPPAQPEPPKAPEAPTKYNFCGTEWTAPQVEAYIKYAHEANQKISDLVKRESEYAENVKAFEAMKSSPTMILVEELEKDSVLRGKVMELMKSDADPNALTNVKVQEANSQIAALTEQVKALQTQLEQRTKKEAEDAERIKQEQEAQAQNAVIGNVRTALADTLAKNGLPETMLNQLGQILVFRVQNNMVQFDQNALIAEGNKLIGEHVTFLNSKLDQQKNDYTTKKNSAPPPPPVGGGGPSVVQPNPTGFRDATSRAKNRVLNALNGLGGGVSR